jgi:Asp-tRNA(Asn)/Glu-tRNA(Gln) amidotransferase B subunit
LLNLGIDKKDAKILVSVHQPALKTIKLMSQRQGVDVKKLASLIVNGKIEYSNDVVNQVYDQYLKFTKLGNTNVVELKEIAEKILQDSPHVVAEYKKGKTGVVAFFVGQAMKETKGKADPQTLNKIILELLK